MRPRLELDLAGERRIGFDEVRKKPSIAMKESPVFLDSGDGSSLNGVVSLVCWFGEDVDQSLNIAREKEITHEFSERRFAKGPRPRRSEGTTFEELQ